MNKTLAAGVVVVAVIALVVGLGTNANHGAVTPNNPSQINVPSTASASDQAYQTVNAELDQMSNAQDASLEDQILTA